MKRRRNPLLDYLAYLGVRAAVCIVQAVSWSTALGLARFAARVGFRLDRRRRLIAEDNLRGAFPHLSREEIARLNAAHYEHLAVMTVETIRMHRILRTDNLNDYVNCATSAELKRINDWFASGRPLMVLTGHFGNWEIFSFSTALRGYRADIIARRIDNPYLNDYLQRLRTMTGQSFLDKSDDWDRIVDVFRRRGVLGMVGDQDAGRRGLFVEFFGRPASTFKSIALLSLEYSAPILVFGTARIGHPMQYRLSLEDVILPEEYADDPDALRSITRRYTAALEHMIRRHPEQYFWMHRRWKTAPGAKRAKRAA